MGSIAASAVVVVLLMSCVYLEPASSAAFEYAFMSSGVSHQSCSKFQQNYYIMALVTRSPD